MNIKIYLANLLRNSRFYVLTGSILLSGVIFLWIQSSVAGGTLQLVKFQQICALLSLVYLYIALLAGPFCYTFYAFPYQEQYLHARRAIGVSAFYFALLHFYITFFDQLGGLNGLGFLDNQYLLALVFGFIGFVILFLLTITSFDFAVSGMGFPRWKFLHRFVYLAGIVILIHTLMLGTHYSALSGTISQVTFIGLVFLLLLEAPRFDKVLSKVFPIPRVGVSFTILLAISSTVYFTIISPLFPSPNQQVSFDIHAAHRQLAQQAAQSQTQIAGLNPKLTNIPGLNGDRTKRYTVSFNNPSNVESNQDVTLTFKVYDAATGNPVNDFLTLYTKPMHCIIVDSQLVYFVHIHPVHGSANNFSVTTQFPHPGIYHIYLEFQPFGGIEQQVGFTQAVGAADASEQASASQTPDTSLTKTFGTYQVTLNTHGSLNAQQMSYGYQTISFTLTDAKTHQPITTIKPYLGAFGHLTMINEADYSFLHVHPYNLTILPPDAHGGPTVDFLPIGIYGPFKPGVYRAFAEFNPDGKLFTADFTVTVN